MKLCDNITVSHVLLIFDTFLFPRNIPNMCSTLIFYVCLYFMDNRSFLLRTHTTFACLIFHRTVNQYYL